ncbi:MAG: hypothetical protein ACI4IR_03505 [Eubacterium sp.]
MGFDFITSILPKEFFIYYAFMLTSSALCGIFTALAINFDAKRNFVKNRNLWAILGFFFGWIVLVVYLICRKKLISKAEKYSCAVCYTDARDNTGVCPNCNNQNFIEKTNPKANKLKTLSIVFLVLAIIVPIVMFGSDTALNISGNFAQSIADMGNNYVDTFSHKAFSPVNAPDMEYYYDKNASAYIDNLEVIYFTENGEEYVYEYRDDGEGLINSSTGEFHSSEECFVDEKGFLIFDDTLYSDMNEYSYYAEKDGETYYWAATVSWDNCGNLVDYYGNFV